jgi:hypothetical protein
MGHALTYFFTILAEAVAHVLASRRYEEGGAFHDFPEFADMAGGFIVHSRS